MRQLLRVVAWIALGAAGLGALGGCGSVEPRTRPGAAGAPVTTPAVDDPLSSKDSTRVFDENTLWRFDLTATRDDVVWLRSHAETEQCIPAELTASGRPIGQVGLRYKGNVGTLENCFDASGNQICSKLSMKIVFSEYDEDKRFYGLKRVNFHALKRRVRMRRDSSEWTSRAPTTRKRTRESASAGT
jgi:spore coat protein CotH